MATQSWLEAQVNGLNKNISNFQHHIAEQQANNERINGQIETIDHAIDVASRAKDKAVELRKTAAHYDYSDTWQGQSRTRYRQNISSNGNENGALGHELVQSIEALLDELRRKRWDLCCQKDYIAELITGFQNSIRDARQNIQNLTEQIKNAIS